MVAMARAARLGGAVGLRVNGPEDIAAIDATDRPHPNGRTSAQLIQLCKAEFHVPIASLLRALNPAKVVVAGGVSQIGEMYMAEVRRVAHQRAKGLAGV